MSALLASLVTLVASSSVLSAQDARLALTPAEARAVAAVEAEGAAHS